MTEHPFDRYGANTGDPKLDALIHQLVHEAGQGQNADLVEEMITTALGAYRDGLGRGDVKIINTAIKELRYSLHVFEPYRAIRKVAVFGSARTPRTDPDYQIAQKLKDPKLVTFKYFFTRKLMFLRESHATILCPGGFGTHDEGFETLTLVQTGKTDPRAIVCLDAPGSAYWKDFRGFLEKHLAKTGMIHKEDMGLMHFTQDPDDAVKYILDFYRAYHSMRYIRDLLVIRIERPLSDAQLEQLNIQFGHIVKKGKITQSLKPFEEEKNAPYTFQLTRLSFYFKKDCYTALNQMIHVINSFG